jgi:penicillin-binding protein 1A
MTNNDQNKNEKKSNKNKKKRRIKYWRVALLIILVLTIIGVGTGAGIAYSYIKDTPPINMDNFVYMEPSIILDKNGDFYQELQGKEKRDVVSIDEIPDMVQKAFISIEDERFEKHKGVDILGIGQAAWQGIKAGDIRTAGGSTLTQQLIKLTQLTPDKNFKRKAQEAYLAIQLERNWTKKQILEAYLNKINFAYAHGVQAAAQTYFRKDVGELSIAQAAVLAAIPKAPSLYKPYITEEKEDGSFGLAYEDEEEEKLVHSTKNKDRALAVIGKLKELEHINESQYNQAREEIQNNEFGLVAPNDTQIYSYFTDALFENVVEDIMEEYNYTEEEAISFLINSGLVIHSTIDPKVQSIMDENFENDKLFPAQSSVAKQVSKALTEEKGEEINYRPEGAMVIIDNKTGHVSGIVGGRNKETSRSINRAKRPFQPGSSTKPLTVYAPGIDSKKLTLGTTYDDVPIIRPSDGWDPTNAGGGSSGMTTVRTGLRRSLNVVAAQAWFDVGLETSVEYGERFGLEFVKEGAANDMNPASLSLGGYTYGQTPLAMASAFSAFPREGVRNEPTFYTKIEDSEGNIVLEKKLDKIQVISPQTAFLITDVLKDVVRGGTTSISVSQMQIAGKTGTTDENRHAWFVGYTPYYTASVWYGYDDNKVVVNGKTHKLNIGIYGGSRPGPAGMWQEVMRDIHKDLDSKNLPSNPGGISSASIDSVSGLLPTELTKNDPRGSTIISEMFINGTVPTEEDNYHVEYEVDVSTNKIASEFCPPELVETKVFISKPEDRFPGPLKAKNPDFVPKSEVDVIAPSEEDVCDIHGPDSLNELQISAPKNTIEINEELQLSIKGDSYDGNPIDINEVEFSSDNDNVVIVNKNTGLIKGVKEGSSNITATITYKYKTLEEGEEVEKEYTRTASIKITVEKAEEVDQDIKHEITLNYSKDSKGGNLYIIKLTPLITNYSGGLDITLTPHKMNISQTSFKGVQSDSIQQIEAEITGNGASLSINVSANGQSKNWKDNDFNYEKEEE